MSDIVERLRESAQYWVNEVDTRKEAADEIERLRGLLRLAEDYVEANQGGWCRDGVGSGIVLKQIRAALAGAAGRPHWSSDDPSVTITPQGEMSVDPECLTCGRSTKRHPGYIIGNHWLESAYERICAGEAEDDVLRDYDVVRVTNQPDDATGWIDNAVTPPGESVERVLVAYPTGLVETTQAHYVRLYPTNYPWWMPLPVAPDPTHQPQPDAVASTFADCETAMGMEYTTPPCACAEYYPGLPHHPDCPTRNADPTKAGQPERCCVDYPRCDCNSPPESDNLPCGHPASLLLRSAETGEPLYCELCDDKSGIASGERDATSAQLAEVQRFIHGAAAVCQHGIRHPWECRECADEAWEKHKADSAQEAAP